MMKPATEILLSAAFVLTPEENWTQKAMARDERGNALHSSWSPDAVSWCVLGAMEAAGDDSGSFAAVDGAVSAYLKASRTKVTAADRDLTGKGAAVARFNNHHTHAEVLDALYRAAELSEARESEGEF